MIWDPRTLVGESLDTYQLDCFVDQGAFGAVYEADDPASGVRVAVKVLKLGAPAQAHEEFNNEGDLLVKLAGASRVVDIFDTGTANVNGTLSTGSVVPVSVRYHVLELAEEGSLSGLIVDPAAISWKRKLELFRDVVLAVHQMHCKDVIHRDLKAANVLLFPIGGKQTIAKVNDFGRSRDLRASPSSRANYDFGRGDPRFAPPEFLWGCGADSQLDHIASDWYALGSLMFELVLGSGVTALALMPHYPEILLESRKLRLDRIRTFRARLAETRAWYEPAFGLLEAEVPTAVRHLVGPTVRQLCDPDPRMRFPHVSPGRRGPRQDHLSWLLRRADSMKLTLKNAAWQAAREARRKSK